MAEKKETTKKPEPIENRYEVIEIGGKEYTLYLGFGFIRELDKRYPHPNSYYGIGIYTLLDGIDMRNTLSLLDYIQAATITEKQKPSIADIEKTVEAWGEKGELEDVFQSFTKRLATSGVTSPIVQKSIALTKQKD